MRIELTVLLLVVSFPVFAYQVGGTSRPNFSTSAATAKQDKPDEEKTSSAPGQARVQTRSFTSYGSRQGSAWRQGVQTKTVQTQTATAQPKDTADEAAQKAGVALNKQVAQAPKKEDVAPAAAPAAKPAPPPAPAANNAPADQAAAMQQLQNVQNMMGALGNMGGTAAPGGAKKGGDTTAPAMPAGMPDLSALMNMSGGQTGAGKK